MLNGRQRGEREIAQRNLQCARRQAKFSCGARKGLEAGAVRSRVTELPNPCQAYLAAKMPADHSETGCTTIHLVDLHDVVDFTDSLSAFAEQALLVSEGSFFIFGPGWRMFTVQLNLVMYLCFGRQQFCREIKIGRAHV